MTRRRWIIAAGAAGALSLLTLLPFAARPGDDQPEEVVASTSTTEPADADAAACDVDAKLANLELTLKDIDGHDVSLASFKGDVIVLNFWATWCAPCKYEIPALVELYSEYKDQGVAILGISVDDQQDLLKPFAEEYQMNYPVLVGAGHEDLENAFGPFWGIPVTVYVSRDGRMCKTHMGLGTKDQFEEDIRTLL